MNRSRSCRTYSSSSRALLFAIIVVSSLTLAACGGGPSSASGRGVRLRGTVLDPGASGGVGAMSTSGSAAAGLTVTVVEDRSMTTTVNPDGSFTLRGLPEGAFHLEFSQNGSVVGTLAFAEVKPNQEITITVQ